MLSTVDNRVTTELAADVAELVPILPPRVTADASALVFVDKFEESTVDILVMTLAFAEVAVDRFVEFVVEVTVAIDVAALVFSLVCVLSVALSTAISAAIELVSALSAMLVRERRLSSALTAVERTVESRVDTCERALVLALMSMLLFEESTVESLEMAEVSADPVEDRLALSTAESWEIAEVSALVAVLLFAESTVESLAMTEVSALSVALPTEDAPAEAPTLSATLVAVLATSELKAEVVVLMETLLTVEV